MEIKIYHNPNCGTSRNTLAMIRHAGVEPQVIESILMNRPFVVTPVGTRLCRPSELVLDILSAPQDGPLTDGEVLIGSKGRRVGAND